MEENVKSTLTDFDLQPVLGPARDTMAELFGNVKVHDHIDRLSFYAGAESVYLYSVAIHEIKNYPSVGHVAEMLQRLRNLNLVPSNWYFGLDVDTGSVALYLARERGGPTVKVTGNKHDTTDIDPKAEARCGDSFNPLTAPSSQVLLQRQLADKPNLTEVDPDALY